MNPGPAFSLRNFPARVAELGFTVNLPGDWIVHELPAEEIDVANPVAFLPLGMVTAPHAAIVLAFAARPAYDDGTLLDWTWYHLNHNGLKPSTVGSAVMAGVPAMVGEATQPSDLGPMVVRFAFLEDGGRLLNVTLTAPELLAGAVRSIWFETLNSFALEAPRGSRFSTSGTEQTHPRTARDAVTPNVAPSDSRDCGGNTTDPPESSPPLAPAQFRDFALADDASALDPDHAINGSLRDRGAGLVPNIVATNDDGRRASVASGAILAQFDLPYGWHAVDDGKRVLVFEPRGRIQIHLDLIPRNQRSNAAILDAIEADARASHAQPQFLRLRQGRIHALGIRGIADGEQPLEQCHMLHPFRDQTMLLRARVTAVPEEATRACNLAELILDSCAFDCFQVRDEPRERPGEIDERPAWWRSALALEASDDLDGAEACIRENCPHIGFAHATADMYRLRMLRQKERGDHDGALAAFRKASDFIFFYASLATSGGEGTALAEERDRFRAMLVEQFGSDPEAER